MGWAQGWCELTDFKLVVQGMQGVTERVGLNSLGLLLQGDEFEATTHSKKCNCYLNSIPVVHFQLLCSGRKR